MCLEIEYPGTSGKCMYNGVPEWNYEEEMVGTTNTIYWAPDSSTFVFVSFDVSEIPLLEYSQAIKLNVIKNNRR
jgi:hypothetical protein